MKQPRIKSRRKRKKIYQAQCKEIVYSIVVGKKKKLFLLLFVIVVLFNGCGRKIIPVGTNYKINYEKTNNR